LPQFEPGSQFDADSQLWRDQGKGDASRDLLAPVYGWFTEGFDTLDLKEAKALLNKLRA
jgi:predicted ATPase